jgi:hypothetical protein
VAFFHENGDVVREKEYSQIYRYICELLEQIAGLLKDEKLSLQEYQEILEAGIGEIKVGVLPLDADRVVEFNQTTGEPRTGRMLAANQAYSQKLQEKADTLELKWLPGYEAPDLLEYVKK